MKKYNFNAGPSILPREVIENTAKQISDFNGSGLSLAEISHRAKDFQPVVDEAVALIKELLQVPEGYSVIFLGGGASLEFCMVPYNFLIKKAAYLNTGTWAKKAMKEAKLFGEVVEVASSADANYTFIPKDWTCPDDVDYLHITTNNTIYGTEIRKDLDVPVRLIADMSSDNPGQGSTHHPHNARLPHSCREGLDVQHSSSGAYLLRARDTALAEGQRRCGGYGQACTAACRDCV